MSQITVQEEKGLVFDGQAEQQGKSMKLEGR